MSTLVTLTRPDEMGISLSWAKARLGVSVSTHDAALTSLIKAGTSRVQSILNRTIRRGRYRERFEQDRADETILLKKWPLSAPVVTSNSTEVVVVDVSSELGMLTIVPSSTTRLVRGPLEAHAALVSYEVIYSGGWLLDEGAVNTGGALVESFVLSSAIAVGDTQISIDASGLAVGATGLLPAYSTVSVGSELHYVKSSSRSGSTLTAVLYGKAAAAHLVGESVYQVDERVPSAIQEEILGLVAPEFEGVLNSSKVDSRVEEISGDGYLITYRDPVKVDEGIRQRLAQWVVRR